jgi:hypothetical protein
MTHKTGPRKEALQRGFVRVCEALSDTRPRLTASERLHVLHDAAEDIMSVVQPWDKERDREYNLAAKLFRDLNHTQMRILKYVLKPDEDGMCPTCPKD